MVINTPVHYKMWIHTRATYSFLQVYQVFFINLTFAAIYDTWIQIKARNKLSPSLHMAGRVWLWDAQERNAHSRIAAPFCFSHSSWVAQRSVVCTPLSLPAMGQLWFLPTGRGGETMAPVNLLSQTSIAFTYTLVKWINTYTCPASFSHAVKGEAIHCTSFFFHAFPICSQAKTSFFKL